jgi:enoyl-CoA hydratase
VRAIERLGTSSAPVIAAVDGPVRAGGIGLMAACDLVVVARAITFAFTEVRIGVGSGDHHRPDPGAVRMVEAGGRLPHRRGLRHRDRPRHGARHHVSDYVPATVAKLCRDLLLGGPNAFAATKHCCADRTHGGAASVVRVAVHE